MVVAAKKETDSRAVKEVARTGLDDQLDVGMKEEEKAGKMPNLRNWMNVLLVMFLSGMEA